MTLNKSQWQALSLALTTDQLVGALLGEPLPRAATERLAVRLAALEELAVAVRRHREAHRRALTDGDASALADVALWTALDALDAAAHRLRESSDPP